METPEERINRITKERISVQPYDPAWPEMFQREKAHLFNSLPNDIIRRIEHFGSTAVPGLSAKPIIDMLIEVSSLAETREKIVPVLESQGYDYFWRPAFGDTIPPFYAWFIKRNPQGHRTHHIHMIENNASFTELWDRLLFRDYLIEFPETAREYERLKFRLAGEFSGDRIAYTEGKTRFITRITKKAGIYYG
ncbi:MAG: GrpB family protein [FCB group bacterium]|nr:GrpB family protein [FCB group bacterium]